MPIMTMALEVALCQGQSSWSLKVGRRILGGGTTGARARALGGGCLPEVGKGPRHADPSFGHQQEQHSAWDGEEVGVEKNERDRGLGMEKRSRWQFCRNFD